MRKLLKGISLVLVFGIVAGVSWKAVHYGFHQVLVKDAQEAGSAAGDVQKPQKDKQTLVIKQGDGALTDVSGMVENVMPSIVAITNISELTSRGWFGQKLNYERKGAGSGIIISEDEKNLYIATNNHVIANATSLMVQFCDDNTVAAAVKGSDAGSDLAVVSVKKADVNAETMSSIKAAAFGTSEELRVGETAVAIGNALGYGQSVTTGIISALNREVSVEDEETGRVVTNELIQTDAAINPGNSGGALLNIKGEVVGINSVKFSDTAVEGIGYAIPIDTASPILNKLMRREAVKHSKKAYFGVSGVDVSGSVAENYNMPEGVYVYRVVEGSPAEEAGILQGDIITSFDGSRIMSKADMEEQLKYCEAGMTVKVKLQRLSGEDNGTYKEVEIEVVLGRKR